jgi:arylsulfatase A-like enzyme
MRRLFTFAICACFALTVSAAKKPNIVFILCDDLGYECVNCYGGTSYKTPNIDALAASGIRFRNAYATPLCSPSRVELMTGRYGFRTGWVNLIGRGDDALEYFDPNKERTFGHVMKSAGYATALAGKWQLCHFPEHPDHVNRCGFDEYCCWTWELNGKRMSRYWEPSIWQNGKEQKDLKERYGEDIFCNFLIDFIKRHRDEPFFVYYPMVLVHEPHTPTPDTSKPVEIGDKKSASQRERRAAKWFPGMVNYMDKTVGRLVATLDELGLRENTVIFFTGDNGTDRSVFSKLGNVTVQGGKGSVTEFGTHVPFIVSWKGTIKAGQVKDDLIDFSDVLPTVADLGSAKLPAVRLDGKSFARQLTKDTPPAREWVFSQLALKKLARDQRFMLHDDGRIYDINQDPFEKKNLADSKDPDVAASKARLENVLKTMR